MLISLPVQFGPKLKEATISDKFSGAIVRNEHNSSDRKSILICGGARGGTSFAASVFMHLGVPFTRGPKDGISARHEHKALRLYFESEDWDRVRRISLGFRKRYPAWGWKLPAIERQMKKIDEVVPDTHYVMIFKEPLSVAVRSAAQKGRNDPTNTFTRVMHVYQRMANSAAETDRPILLISYDQAVANLPAFLRQAADFAGISAYDEATVLAGIRGDSQRYFTGEKKGGTSRGRGMNDSPAQADIHVSPSA